MPPPPNLEQLKQAEYFPGMIPAEVAVLRDFIRARGHLYDAFEFNVRLGEGGDAPPDATDEQRSWWRRLTQKRADAIAYTRPNLVTILEVKVKFGLAAFGQLWGYGELYRREFPTRIVSLVALARRADTDVRVVMAKRGVTLVTYEDRP